jgi:putative addiction module CopG family antidote
LTLNEAVNCAESEDGTMDARRLSIELPEEVAETIDARIASGRNASESDVVREALELLAAQDGPLEDWMAEELIAGYDAWRADPACGIPLEEVSARLDEERALRRAGV